MIQRRKSQKYLSGNLGDQQTLIRSLKVAYLALLMLQCSQGILYNMLCCWRKILLKILILFCLLDSIVVESSPGRRSNFVLYLYISL